MKKTCIIAFVAIFISTFFTHTHTAYAQQDTRYTQYAINNLVLNPAYTGSRDALSFLATYRNQWVNLDGAPKTFAFNAHAPFAGNNGAGIFLETEKIGIHNRTSVFASYAYHLPINPETNAKLSLGVQAGVYHYQSNWADAPAKDGSDIIFQNNYSKTLPNFGLAAFYYTPTYYAGISIPFLLTAKFDSTTRLTTTAKAAAKDMPIFVSGGYVFDLNENLKLKPTALLKYVAKSPVQVDLNLQAIYQNALWGGIGYHSGDAINLLAGYQFKNSLRIGYSFDLSLNELAAYNKGSHEILLGYDLQLKKKGGDNNNKKEPPILSPRFF